MNLELSGSDQLAVLAGYATFYRGFTIRNLASDQPAIVRITDSIDGIGTTLEEISLGPSESAREYYADMAFKITKGVYVQVVSGTISGSLRLA